MHLHTLFCCQLLTNLFQCNLNTCRFYVISNAYVLHSLRNINKMSGRQTNQGEYNPSGSDSVESSRNSAPLYPNLGQLYADLSQIVPQPGHLAIQPPHLASQLHHSAMSGSRGSNYASNLPYHSRNIGAGHSPPALLSQHSPSLPYSLSPMNLDRAEMVSHSFVPYPTQHAMSNPAGQLHHLHPQLSSHSPAQHIQAGATSHSAADVGPPVPPPRQRRSGPARINVSGGLVPDLTASGRMAQPPFCINKSRILALVHTLEVNQEQVMSLSIQPYLNTVSNH